MLMPIFLHLLLCIYGTSLQFLCADLQGKILMPGVSHALFKADAVSANLFV